MLKPELVVVNVDTGPDDAWALLALVAAQRLGLVRILAVLISPGNTDLFNVALNTCRFLQTAGAENIPVHLGAANYTVTEDYWGKDGFCDSEFDWEPDLGQVQLESGIELLKELTTQYPGEISLICQSPLTTIAQAMRKYPAMSSKLKEIFIMGGGNYIGSDEYAGSVEFNFLADPESANHVLTEGRCPITLLPIEPCQSVSLTVDWRDEVFEGSQSPAVQLLNYVESACRSHQTPDPMWMMADLFLAMSFLDDRVVAATMAAHVSVELTGTRRGELVVDTTSTPNAIVITQLNSEELAQAILTFSQPPNC